MGSLKNILFINIIITCLFSGCRSRSIERYIGLNDIKVDEVTLSLNSDNSFKMDLFINGNYKEKPQKTLIGTWSKNGKELILTTTDNKIVYKYTCDKYILSGKPFKIEYYKFKFCKNIFFGTNIDLNQDFDK